MNKLIEINEEKTRILNEELQKVGLFSSAEQFIEFYNSGMITTSMPVIKNLADLVQDTYRNVKSYSKKFVVLTEEEVAFDTTIELLKAWKLVSALKRVALQMLDESFPADTKMVFLKSHAGVLHYVTDEYAQTLEKYWTQEKLFSGHATLYNNIFLRPYVKVYNEEEDSLYIKLEDVVDLDDSFIIDYSNSLIKQTLDIASSEENTY